MRKLSKKFRKNISLREYELKKIGKLEAIRRKSAHEVTGREWAFLKRKGKINGCGGECTGRGLCKITRFLAGILSPLFFVASCNKHDFGYWKGGDEMRRKECDEKFLKAILEDIENISENCPKKIFYTIIAYLFYFAVRIGGRKYFNYY